MTRGRHLGLDVSHRQCCHRLRFVRALIEVGGIAGARSVIDAIDSDLPLEQTFGIDQRTVSDEIDPGTLDPAALERVDGATCGWDVSSTSPGRLAAELIVIGTVLGDAVFAVAAALGLVVDPANSPACRSVRNRCSSRSVLI